MQGVLDKVVLRTLFYDQIKNSTVMKEDVAHYDRCTKDSPDKTYDWLVQRVRAYLNHKRRTDNREKQITLEMPLLPLLPPPMEREEAGGKVVVIPLWFVPVVESPTTRTRTAGRTPR